MHDFGKLVYLDVQKTGSTFISKFLNSTCRLPRVKHQKHQRIINDFQPDSFYFISVRNPLSQYASLYRYGLDGKGMLRRRLDEHGYSSLYREEDDSGFGDWLRFVLDCKNADFMGEGYEEFAEKLEIGFLSFRFLVLSLVCPIRRLRTIKSYDQLIQVYRRRNIARIVVKQEKLNQGLFQIATKLKPEFFDQEKVVAFLDESQKLNASKSLQGVRYTLDKTVMKLVLDREKFLFSHFYKGALDVAASREKAKSSLA